MSTAQKQNISPAQRAELFAQMTRQNFQMLPSQSCRENDTVQFTLPKVRMTNRVRLEVEAKVKVTHATSTAYLSAPFAPYTLLSRVGVDMNNGFSPFTMSGKEAYMYSCVTDYQPMLNPAVSGRGKVVQGRSASPSGSENTIRFLLDLPLTLNDRDPVGLILTQNQETNVTISVTVGQVSALLDDTVSTGYKVELKSLTITPLVESFSVPAHPNSFPDISILKIVQASRQAYSGPGQQVMKLPVGMTYRKLILFIEDKNGKGVADTDLTGNIEIIFNQADIPYVIKPSILAAYNHEQFKGALPKGMYVFDFSYQGMSGYGGARDYVDTERLTEFWVRFNSTGAGQVTAVYEMLSQLK